MRRAHVFLVAAIGLLAAACSARTPARPQCQVDDQCGAGACVGGSCIARMAAAATWAVELEPRADSLFALSDLPSVSSTNGQLQPLTAGAKVNVTGTLTSPSTPALTSAHVVAAVPSAIAGRPDLQFAADLAASVDATAAGAAPQFSLMVPEGTLGRQASVQVFPISPQDAAFAPLVFTAALRAALSFAVPTDTYVVRGRFFNAIRQPIEGYMARAFLNGQLASTVSLTDVAGSFSLIVPGATIASNPLTQLSVEIKPLDPTSSDPRFTTVVPPLMTPPFTGSIDLGSLYQAAFTQPNVFRVSVHGETDDGQAVVGALVRAHAVLAQDASDGGTTDFQRDERTDAQGGANISLLPGTASSVRTYTFAVIPPPESPFGTKCVAGLPLLAGGTAIAPANLQPVVVPRRPQLAGTVVDANGQPAAGVVVAATRTAADDNTACMDAVGAPPANANTDASGRFTLLLDSGTYQLDYDPPAGSPIPRLTETGIRISGNLDHDVQLQAGGLIEGDAVGADASPLPSAAVRVYLPTAAATLLGQARTDTHGHFRVVIPLAE